MTKEAILDYQIQAEIPLAFMRFLENRTDERVLEVVLVYNGVDRYDTIIDPEGMRSDPNIVTIDYNHRGVNTGAYLKNVRVENNYKLEDGTILEKALIGNVHIPQDAEMFFMDKDGQKRSNGNLYDAVSKGQVRSVSVEFRPYKGKQITDTKTGITTYREWDLIRLSLLDITPGQPYSSIKITRSLINNRMSIDEIKTALANGDVSKEDLMALCMPENQTPEDNSEREIEIEVGTETTSETEVPAEADTNQDGEISDQEIRAYIKEVKRAFGDNPSLINEKVAEVERMCGELKKRMDDMVAVGSDKREEAKDETITGTTEDTNEIDEEEKEAQRIRALKDNLNGIPEKKQVEASVVRQLGEDEVETQDTQEDKNNELVNSYRKAHGLYFNM